eukprot:GGOE01062219.1.p1 GENE.GGOE01062219.1~~GGOE01062219.1.p1  ORF type:complete len:785 (-),score=164.19 GGOE01062219.1:158-2512(-)
MSLHMSKVNVFDTGNFRTINLVDDVKKPLDGLSPEVNDTKRKREKKQSSKRLTHSASYRVQGVVEEDLSWIVSPQDPPAPSRKQRSQNRTAGNRESPSPEVKPSAAEGDATPHAQQLFSTANARMTIMHQFQHVQHKLVRETYDRERLAGGVSSAPHPMLRHKLQIPSPGEVEPSHPAEGIPLQEYVLGQLATTQEGINNRPTNRARPTRSNENAPICPPKIIDNRPATRQKLPTESLDLFLPGRPGGKKDDLDSESDDDGLQKAGTDVASFGCLFIANDNEFGDEPEFPSKSAGGAFRVSQVDWNEAIMQDDRCNLGGSDGKENGASRKKSGKHSSQKEKGKDRKPQIAVIQQGRPCDDVYIDESSQGDLDPRVVDEWLQSSFEPIEDQHIHDLDSDQDDDDQGASLYDLLVSQKPLASKQSGHHLLHFEELGSSLGKSTLMGEPPASGKSSKKSKKRDSGDQGGTSTSAHSKDRSATFAPDADVAHSTALLGRAPSSELPLDIARTVSSDETLDRLTSRRKLEVTDPSSQAPRDSFRELRVSPVVPHEAAEQPVSVGQLQQRPMSSAGTRRPRDGVEGRLQNLPKNLDLDEFENGRRRGSSGLPSPDVTAKHDGVRPPQPDVIPPPPSCVEMKRPMSSKGARPGGSASLRSALDSRSARVIGGEAASPAEAKPWRVPSFPEDLDSRRSGPKGYMGDELKEARRPPSGLRADDSKSREPASRASCGVEVKGATTDVEGRRMKPLPPADITLDRLLDPPDTSSGQCRRFPKEPRSASEASPVCM